MAGSFSPVKTVYFDFPLLKFNGPIIQQMIVLYQTNIYIFHKLKSWNIYQNHFFFLEIKIFIITPPPYIFYNFYNSKINNRLILVWLLSNKLWAFKLSHHFPMISTTNDRNIVYFFILIIIINYN